MTTVSHPRRVMHHNVRLSLALAACGGLLTGALLLAGGSGDPQGQTAAQPPPQEVRNPDLFKYQADPKAFAEAKHSADTTYEEVMGVGYNLERNELEAIVHIKRPTGYGGNLCSPGSQEYVRFFVDYGGGWVDLGLAHFNVHDIPNALDCEKKTDKPLQYAVRLPEHLKQSPCDHPLLPRVRAILSWQMPPPAGAAHANWLPPWGNRVDCHIQTRTYTHPPVKPLVLAELHKTYAQAMVEPHRFGTTALAPMLQPDKGPAKLPAPNLAEWKKLGLDGQLALNNLVALKGNTNYEVLERLGLDTDLERLTALFRVKRSTGYSGNLCQHGSTEYVAFWADWDDKCHWTYLGTVKVQVHDIASIPKDGLCYAAVLPVNLAGHHKDCKHPRVGRVRAVLSWGVPPSVVDPNALPYWGNRLDAHVQIKAVSGK
jgi:hypothetical protein